MTNVAPYAKRPKNIEVNRFGDWNGELNIAPELIIGPIERLC
jgi:hypothetical protein